MAGDKDAVYPILKWVVPQPQVLEKRAFIGYYLSMPDVSVTQAVDTTNMNQHQSIVVGFTMMV